MSKNNSSFGVNNILKIVSKEGAHVHFTGVGGVSMSSLFCLSSHFGISVSGSDLLHGEYMDALLSVSQEVYVSRSDDKGQRLPERTSLVVYSLAVREDDPELCEAEKSGIPVVSRAEYLSAIMTCYKRTVGVSGSHGKSTVTAMLSKIFSEAGKSPTTLSGAPLSVGGGAFLVGALDYLIYEACEYKDSFLKFNPTVSVLLNLELDHVDYFNSLDSLAESFTKAANRAGRAVINAEDPELAKIVEKIHTPPITFGKSSFADYRYEVISSVSHALSFDLYYKGNRLGNITLPMIGEFNIVNAVASCVCAITCGISFDVCTAALSDFHGIGRRLEIIGEYNGRRVYYDYAHHPTEIREGIKAVKSDTGGDVTVIFGAHTYSRTKGLWQDFVRSLSLADHIILTEISAIREAKIDDISADLLAQACGGTIVLSEMDLKRKIEKTAGSIVVMGAADMSWVKNFLLSS